MAVVDTKMGVGEARACVNYGKRSFRVI